jgi:hypothetical protein
MDLLITIELDRSFIQADALHTTHSILHGASPTSRRAADHQAQPENSVACARLSASFRASARSLLPHPLDPSHRIRLVPGVNHVGGRLPHWRRARLATKLWLDHLGDTGLAKGSCVV